MKAAKQKRKIRWVISLFLVMLCFSGLTVHPSQQSCYGELTQAQYGGGSGEPNDPYFIYTAEQMNEIGNNPSDWDKHFVMVNDINLADYTGTQFNIIGPNSMTPFTGVFDGNDHTIRNFTYTSTGTNYIGLFGCFRGGNAEIKDLTLIDPNVDGGTGVYVGSLVGNLSGSITSCYAKGGSVSGNYLVGGLIGIIGSLGGTVINCYATCSISGNESIGGLVGFNNGNIFRCYSAGSVTGNNIVGGLVGENTAGFLGAATIFNCYSTASVSGNDCVGGLVGANVQSAVISKCYSYGRVSETAYVGGLVGCNDNWAPDSFWDMETSDCNSSDGGAGKITAEMKTKSTFTDAGWDFVDESVNGTEDIWSICEGTNYPRFVWQIPAGDFVCPDGITIEDFVFFIEHWRDDNCDVSNDYCQGTDLDFSGTVDTNDLEILVANWLEGGNN